MTSPDRVLDALETVFREMSDCRAWQADLVAESARAARRQTLLARTLRSLIEALPAPDRAPHLDRLRDLTGVRKGSAHGRARPTDRTRAALAWLATRDPAEFHTGELRAHLTERGETLRPTYIPTLMARFRRRGIVEGIGHGRYRVNREHPELLG